MTREITTVALAAPEDVEIEVSLAEEIKRNIFDAVELRQQPRTFSSVIFVHETEEALDSTTRVLWALINLGEVVTTDREDATAPLSSATPIPVHDIARMLELFPDVGESKGFDPGDQADYAPIFLSRLLPDLASDPDATDPPSARKRHPEDQVPARKRHSDVQSQALVDAWNEHHEVGCAVIVITPEGKQERTVTRASAEYFAEAAPTVKTAGRLSWYPLDRVIPVAIEPQEIQGRLDRATEALRWVAEGFNGDGCICDGDGSQDWPARVSAGTDGYDEHAAHCGAYVSGYVDKILGELSEVDPRPPEGATEETP